MNTLYGEINNIQLDDFKKKLHSKIHWLLIYKESDDFNVDFDNYFTELMKYVGALGKVFNKDSLIIEILTMLQIAYDESTNDNFNHKRYRHYVLEAHNLVDRLEVSE
ncbi:MAG: hypothetical protein K5655_04310 [Lachnospiraceae bacterium]|nr:hypothetical protein [Lachnospiraceae bacterium]